MATAEIQGGLGKGQYQWELVGRQCFVSCYKRKIDSILQCLVVEVSGLEESKVTEDLNLERWYYQQKMEQEASAQGKLKSLFENGIVIGSWIQEKWMSLGTVEMQVIYIEVGDCWSEVQNKLKLNLVASFSEHQNIYVHI